MWFHVDTSAAAGFFLSSFRKVVKRMVPTLTDHSGNKREVDHNFLYLLISLVGLLKKIYNIFTPGLNDVINTSIT